MYRANLAYAPLAQLVEQLTLNQWVLGSSPRWCTKYRKYKPCCFGLFPLWYVWNLRRQGFPLVGLQSNAKQGTSKAPVGTLRRTCGGFLLNLGCYLNGGNFFRQLFEGRVFGVFDFQTVGQLVQGFQAYCFKLRCTAKAVQKYRAKFVQLAY